MNTNEQLNNALVTEGALVIESGASEPAAAILWPSPAWFAALDAQVTPATLTAAARFARTQLAILERLGLRPDGDEEDMTQQLLDAIIGGQVRWDPRVPLGAFLHNKLSDLGARLRRGRRLTVAAAMMFLDHLDEEHPLWSTDALHAPGDLECDLDLFNIARRTEVEIWDRARDDREALLLLAALRDADTDRELAAATGLSRAAVIAAKRRLRRYGEKVSRELQSDVRDVLCSVDRARTGAVDKAG
jgi:hypothetical protein